MGEIKRRSESVWGIHMDFHAKPEDDAVIGATLREEDIREICRTLAPDFIEIDCKGHPGWASYPTSMGNAVPRFAFDTLALWRRVTREEGVALYMHYSGLMDVRYAHEHPEDCIRKGDGSLSDAIVKSDGRYVDELMIPQITELIEKYGVDGVWVDGDCWAAARDFSPESLAAFERDTGVNLGGKQPAKPGDPYFDLFREHEREKYRAYLRHYTDVLHSRYPAFQIASNWAFTDHMPEPVTADVDFLSGDFNLPFSNARYAGRAIAAQGLPWDLMAMSFSGFGYGTNGLPIKPTVQLLQEAAEVLSLGGALQVDVLQFKDGSPNTALLLRLAPVASFIRERQSYCFGGRNIPQVQMLLSTEDREAEMDPYSLFCRTGMERLSGLTSLLCDAGQSLEIVMDHTLNPQSPVIVVPELYRGVSEATRQKLVDYVRNGGNLVLVGCTTARFFAGSFGYGLSETPVLDVYNFIDMQPGKRTERDEKNDAAFFSSDGVVFGLVAHVLNVEAAAGQPAARLYSDFRTPVGVLAPIIPFGKGRVVPIAADLGGQYDCGRQCDVRKLIADVMNRLYAPLARIESAVGLAELNCLDVNGRMTVQLVNVNGSHSDANSLSNDTIPPVTDLKISLGVRPAGLTLWPEGKKLDFTEENGRTVFTVPKLDIHSVVEISM